MLSAESTIGSGQYKDVEHLLNTFHLAAENANLSVYFSCYHKNGIFIGTDPDEHWTVNEFHEFAKPHFNVGKGWTYQPIKDSRKLHFHGPVADSPNYCVFDELVYSESFKVVMRGTGSLIREGDSPFWFIASYHLSFAIPNSIASIVCTKLQSYERGKQGEAADKAAAALLAELELEEAQCAKEISQLGHQKKGSNKSKKKK